MEEFGIPRNKIKDLMGLSGECFCGSNAYEENPAKKSEWETIQSHPLLADVKAELNRLKNIATDLGLPNEWGKQPHDEPSAAEWEDLPLFMDLCVGCQK